MDKELLTPLGERIKKRREEFNLSPDLLARKLQCPAKYILAIEEGKYEVFPAKVYALGFFKKLIEELGLEEENLLKEFAAEWEVINFRRDRTLKPLPQNRGIKPYLTPKQLGMLGMIFIFMSILVFFGIRVLNFIKTPALIIKSPPSKSVQTSPLITIQGKVKKESQLTVNSRKINIDEEGNFKEEVGLRPGLNILRFWAKDKFGKEAHDTRYILVK